MSVKIGDRFYVNNGLSKEDIAADLLGMALEPDQGFPPDADGTPRYRFSIDEQAYLVAYIVKRLTDEQCLRWVEEHDDNAMNVLGEEYGTDTYFGSEAEIDNKLVTELGFRDTNPEED